MKKASLSQTVFIGITLFSMFFGAGNLIFAPYMGVQSGSGTWLALTGFICTAVILPISAVVIISLFGDALEMVSTLNRKFAVLFITLIYLLIGPCVAIPRTASTSYEMFGWLLPQTLFSRVLYTVLFFAACALTAWKPGKLKNILGKIMGPVLVGMILVLCLAGPVEHIPGEVTTGLGFWGSTPFLTGFNEGYQTMDILAAFCFGIVILLNIQDMGITSPKEQHSLLIRAACIAGVLLAFLYALLALAGMEHSGDFQSLSNGALILSALAESEFGSAGSILISLIFLAACYNVCSGLLSCCATYFLELTGKGKYETWLAGFTLAGAAVAVFGLDTILAVSAPVLSVICPIAILLLIWGLFVHFGRKK